MKKKFDSNRYDYFSTHRHMLCSFNELCDYGITTVDEYRMYLREL